MICLPNRKRALAVSSMRVLVRNRIGAPLTIIISPWRSSRTRFDMSAFLVRPAGLRAAGIRLASDDGGMRVRPDPGESGRFGPLSPGGLGRLDQRQQRRWRLVGDGDRLRRKL